MRARIYMATIAVLLAACGSAIGLRSTPAPGASPTTSLTSTSPAPPSDSATPSPPAPSPLPSIATPTPTILSATPQGPVYGVVIDLLGYADLYGISVVGTDGSLQGAVRNAKRKSIATAAGHAIQLPYVSASSTALYALQGDAGVSYMLVRDRSFRCCIMSLPVTTGMEAAFAVSPDDRSIAYSTLDFNRTPVHVALYTELLGGGNRQVIFESDTDYVWPVAWHGGLLVLAHASGPYEEDISKAAPARDNPYSAISYHLVDPTNANRKVLMGGCTVSGPLSPAGSACIQGATIDWSGGVSPAWSTHNWGSISAAASLSPDGLLVAATDPSTGAMDIWRRDGSVAISIDGPGVSEWAGWLDPDHIILGNASNRSWPMRVVNVRDGSAVNASGASGFYAAILPTNIT